MVVAAVSRSATEKKPPSELSLEEAQKLIRDGVRLCFLRDCRASSRYHMATVSRDGTAVVEGPHIIDSNWEVEKQIVGYE